MLISRKKICFSIFLIGVMISSVAQATIYPLGDSGWSMIVRSDPTLPNQVQFPYVYSANDDNVVIELGKIFFGGTDGYGNLDPVLITFQKTDEDASSNIVIRDEFVINDTQYTWKDYHMFLLVNSVDPGAGFDSTQTPYGDQLETVSYSNFVGYNPDGGALPIQLNFSTTGAGVSNVNGDNIFNPGYRSVNGYDPIVIVTDPDLPVGSLIGLKQIPTVPEPMTIVMLLAGFGLWWFKRK